MKKNVIEEKSFDFAVRIVQLSKQLQVEREYVISKQILKSGTSIGANVREGIMGQSKKDFISKLQISLKESYETEYWLDLLHATEYLDTGEYEKLRSSIKEIIRILTAILKTSKSNL